MVTKKGTSVGYESSAADRLMTDDVAGCLRHNPNYARDLHKLKLCILQEMFITAMNCLHYYYDIACPRTNSCTKRYSGEVVQITLTI